MAAAGIIRSSGAFVVTPHKVSICILLQIYAPPAQISILFPFSSVSHHNRLGLYLLVLTKSCDDILEPKLDELVNQLRKIGGEMDQWLTDHLTNRLSALSTPDDLFNFFTEMRRILGGPDSGVVTTAIGRGVPFLAWPIRGDQYYNSKLVARHLKVGCLISDDMSWAVKKEDIAKGIERLMRDEEIKKRAVLLSEKFHHGFPASSVASLDAFRDFISKKED